MRVSRKRGDEEGDAWKPYILFAKLERDLEIYIHIYRQT